MLRLNTPPCAFTYWKYAFEAGAISEYPGAAGPVSGCVLPMVTVVGVMPGAEAELLVDPPPLLPPQAATTAAATQMDPTTAVFDLLIRELMPGPPWSAVVADTVCRCHE